MQRPPTHQERPTISEWMIRPKKSVKGMYRSKLFIWLCFRCVWGSASTDFKAFLNLSQRRKPHEGFKQPHQLFF